MREMEYTTDCMTFERSHAGVWSIVFHTEGSAHLKSGLRECLVSQESQTEMQCGLSGSCGLCTGQQKIFGFGFCDMSRHRRALIRVSQSNFSLNNPSGWHTENQLREARLELGICSAHLTRALEPNWPQRK